MPSYGIADLRFAPHVNGMLRVTILVLFCFSAPPLAANIVTVADVDRAAISQTPPETRPSGVDALAAALEAKDAGRWNEAKVIAEWGGPIAMDIVEWHRLRGGLGSFFETQEFLRRQPDWPGLPLLRKRNEKSIPADARVVDVLGFFENDAPQTLIGSLRLAQAYRAIGQEKEAVAEIRRGWRSFASSADDEREALAHFGPQLVDAHTDRLDAMLWQGAGLSALRQSGRVSEDLKLLAQARLGLQSEAPNIDRLLEAVPGSLQSDPGLAYDRFKWRLEKRRRVEAIELILGRSISAKALGVPDAWSADRIDLVRDLMGDKAYGRAYRLAANHYLTEGRDYAELEWLAGYIALRWLNNPARALSHFKAQGTAVTSPISLGRTHYWQGRALEALGQTSAAQDAYRKGGVHQTAFYGLLAAEKAGMDLDPRLAGTEEFPVTETAAYLQSSVFEAAEMLLASGNPRLAVRFMTHLAETQDRTTIGEMAARAEALNQPFMELLLAKRGVRYGMLLERAYHPLHPIASLSGDVPAELVLSIARRESEFFTDARSGVGAQGIMQLMPPTAREMAGKAGVSYSQSRLSTDATYNATLGITYLDELIDRFGNSPIQIAAAYNAGPSRPSRWMREFGDPRRGEIDIVDWVESIPFDETRNYVMRVTESMPAYRARLTGQTGPVRFSQELNGQYIAPPPPAAPATSKRPVARPSVPATE